MPSASVTPARTETLAERIQAAKLRDEERSEQVKTRKAWMGDDEMVYDDPGKLFDRLTRVPEEVSVELTGIDRDGDARFVLTGRDREVIVYLSGESLVGYEVSQGMTGGAEDWARQVRRAVSEIDGVNGG
jgi:hypothetical protein